MAKVLALVDERGRILAAQFAEEAEKPDDERPAAQLMPLPGQRPVEFDVPDEIERLSGPDLTHFFTHVEVAWPARVTPPRIELVRQEHDRE